MADIEAGAMGAVHHKLGELAAALERQGADPQRIDLVRRAQRFKRSWLEMAEALVRVRQSGAYRDWGYEDFHGYCAGELRIRRATVDKLTASYVAVERHAPEVLDPDSDAEAPTHDAADYFARALGLHSESGAGPQAPPPPDPSDDVVGELRQAVFEEGAPVSVLRRRFDPVLFPKPPGVEELEALEKTRAATRRLIGLLSRSDQLPRETVIRAEDALEALQEDLERVIAQMREPEQEAPVTQPVAAGRRQARARGRTGR